MLNIVFFTGSLMFLNEATLLHNLKIRYQKDKIYVSFNFLYTVHVHESNCTVQLVSRLRM